MADGEFQTGEGPNRLPQGSATEIGALEDAVPEFLDPLEGVEPATEDDLFFDEEEGDEEDDLEPDDEDRAFLYTSDRRDEPGTQGAPVGPGSPILSLPAEDAAGFRARVADVLETSPGATQRVKALAARLRSGL